MGRQPARRYEPDIISELQADQNRWVGLSSPDGLFEDTIREGYRTLYLLVVRPAAMVMRQLDMFLFDSALAFNQLCQGAVESVDIFPASRGTMPISGLPGKPPAQWKNERSRQALIWFLDATRPAALEQLRKRITRFRSMRRQRKLFH